MRCPINIMVGLWCTVAIMSPAHAESAPVTFYKDVAPILQENCQECHRPADTRIEYTAWYDNSPEMAEARGFDPKQTVRFGQKSTDEMMMGFVMGSVVPEDESD